MSPTASPSSAPDLPEPTRRTGRRFTHTQKALRWLRRMTFLVHRWLGIALALLMAVWTLSGVVMMYVSYPETSEAERLAGLAPLHLSGCCAEFELPEGTIEGASVEMLLGRPVLRLMTENGPRTIWLSSGEDVRIGEAEGSRIAAEHMRRAFDEHGAVRTSTVEVDQWTLQLRRDAPLYRSSVADGPATTLYVSGLTGEVVQDTTRRERFWNWLGAVPHWLYFTQLRQDGALWAQVVIWAALLGTFLTLTGIYVGIRMYGRGRRWSPLRGVALWHHWTGLVFGIATLTWVFSGFASMQPWGLFEGEGPAEELAAMKGRPVDKADAVALVQALESHPQAGVVSASVIIEQGRSYAVLVAADDTRARHFLPGLAPSPPTEAELSDLARSAKQGIVVASQMLIKEGDNYHYIHHSSPVILPAWRTIWANEEKTRLYLDPRTGEPVGFVDAGYREFRWWHSALHRLDFLPFRTRPLWDLVMLISLTGVSLICFLGVVLGWKRLRRGKTSRHLR